jgi:hypothetical protein
LLDQIEGPLASFTGDGAYDQDGVYRAVIGRDPDAAVIVPPRATAVPSETAGTAPTLRDQHLRCIADKGKIGWQKVSGYTKRSRVEAAIGRYKQVTGDGLGFHKDERRTTEVGVAVHVLNRMLELRRPISVRIPRVQMGRGWCDLSADPRNKATRASKSNPLDCPVWADRLEHAPNWTASVQSDTMPLHRLSRRLIGAISSRIIFFPQVVAFLDLPQRVLLRRNRGSPVQLNLNIAAVSAVCGVLTKSIMAAPPPAPRGSAVPPWPSLAKAFASAA